MSDEEKPLSFKEWAETYRFVGFGDGDEEMKTAQDAWNACKEQVLKIMKNRTTLWYREEYLQVIDEVRNI